MYLSFKSLNDDQYKYNILNKIKCEKGLTKKEIDNENICVIRILDDENFNKLNVKFASCCNVKGIIDIIANNNNNNTTLNENKIQYIRNYNLLRFNNNNNNKTFINILLDYEIISNIADNLDSIDLKEEVLNVIEYEKNIIICIDYSLCENVQKLTCILTYILYNLYFSKGNFNSIKIKCKHTENIRYALQYIRDNDDNDNDINIQNMIAKKEKDERLKTSLGGIKLNSILHNRNIKNVSKNKMRNTHKLLKSYLEKCYDSDIEDIDIHMKNFNNVLDTFEYLCKVDNNDNDDNSNKPLFPPMLVNLELLHTIFIKMPSQRNNDDDDDGDDNNNNINFVFNGSNNDSFTRKISYEFFENADIKLITSVFQDLFLHNTDKMNNLIHLILHKSKIEKPSYDKNIFEKIYTSIENILSSNYNINNVSHKTNKHGDLQYKFNAIDKKRKTENEKRKTENEKISSKKKKR